MRPTSRVTRVLAAVTLSLVSLGPAVPAVAHEGANPHKGASQASSERGGPITRDEIISRTDDWVEQGMPYSQVEYAPDGDGHFYRQDCSGFISLALHASRSFSTRTIHEISTPVSKNQLRPGDYLNSEDHHVVLFLGWANKEHTWYHAREASSVKGGTLERTVPYPYYSREETYEPLRYENVVEGN